VTTLRVRYRCCDREYTYPEPLGNDPLGQPMLNLKLMAWADALHAADHPRGQYKGGP
jgi:hypothetical protein